MKAVLFVTSKTLL